MENTISRRERQGLKSRIESAIMSEHYIFVVFYRHHGEDYSAVFQGMRAAKQFARTTGGRVGVQLSNVFIGA